MTDAPQYKHTFVVDPEDPTSVFGAHKALNRWALLKMARAEAQGTDEEQAAAFYTLIMTIVVPEERDRLDDYMMEHGDDEGMTRLQDAVERFVKGETQLPLEPSSTSSTDGTTTPPTSEGTSSEPATLPVKRVDFSAGTTTVDAPEVSGGIPSLTGEPITPALDPERAEARERLGLPPV